MSLSVIIITYNSSDTIGACLSSFKTWLNKGSNLEIVLVDNASIDDTIGIVQRQNPHIKIVSNAVNVGFASAVNRGIDASQSDYILLLNPDTILDENFFPELFEYLQGIESPAIVGCKLLNVEGTHQVSTWKVPSLLTLSCEMFLPYKMSLPIVTERHSTTGKVPTVTGAAMAFHRDVFLRVGGFDENFFMYIEDLDFCIRAKKMGYSTYYFDRAKVKHIGGKSSSKSPENFFINYYSSKLYFFKKHHPGFAYDFATAILYTGCLVRIVAYALAGFITHDSQFAGLSKFHVIALRKIFH